MFKKEEHKLLNFTFLVILGFIFFYVLHIGADLIIPFIIGLLISFAIIGFSGFYQKFRVTSSFATFLSLISFVLIFWGIGELISANLDLNEVTQKLPEYQSKFYYMLIEAASWANITEEQVNKYINIKDVFTNLDLKTIVLSTASGVTEIFKSAGMIFFFIIFILLEHRHIGQKISLMFTDEHKKTEILSVIAKIKSDVKTYFVIKMIISMFTASLSYFLMTFFELDFAFFWTIIIFLLNFIPSVGSIIATIFPVVVAFSQFENPINALMITVGLVGIQVLMGNIIEPRFMGNKLNLSPLLIIISLAFWGKIWGIPGMLLSVPIMVIMNIILAKIPATKSLAILFSEKGELQVEGVEAIENRKKLLDSVKNKFQKKRRRK
ncbi:MAG: AI-2E family transporter [Candidatus Gracilibacteria bacterium]|nr:AI-2E family transporter [Candidatus Gracilibacteria bacterium]